MIGKVLLAAGLLAVAVVATDVGAAAVAFGPTYVWRLMAWRQEGPADAWRFPARPVAASAAPLPFPVAAEGAGAVRAAFRAAGIAGAQAGESLDDFARRTGTTSLLVLRDGRLMYEGYFNGAARDGAVPSFSMAKSVTSVLIGAAIAEGRIPSLDTPAETLLPDVPGLRGSGVTLRHILAMTSGFRLDNTHPLGPLSVPWTAGNRIAFATDLRAVARGVRPEVPPGTRFLYDDRNAMLLGLILERVTGGTVSAWLQQTLWQPMGAEYGANWNLDSRASGFEKMETGLNARPLDFLKLGEIMRRGGVRPDGVRVLPQDWAELSMRLPASGPDRDVGDGRFYTLMWWGLRRAAGPPDIFANGIFGQVLLVSRADNTVILRTGTADTIDWPHALQRLSERLVTGGPRADGSS